MQSGVGHTDAIQIEDGKLLAAGVVSRDTVAAREIVASARNGFPWQASLAAAVEEFEFVKPSQKALVNGREFSGPVNVVRRATLGEISFVDLGADGADQRQRGRHVHPPHAGGTARWPDSNTIGADSQVATPSEGAAPATSVPAAAPAAARPLAGTRTGRPVATTGAERTRPAVAAVDEIRAAAAAETARIAAMRQVCAGQHPEIEAQAIREGWDATRTRTGGPADEPPDGPGGACPPRNASTAPCSRRPACLTAKLEGVENFFDEQTLEAAQKRFRGGIGLQELLWRPPGPTALRAAASATAARSCGSRSSRSWRPGSRRSTSAGSSRTWPTSSCWKGSSAVERTWRNICAVRNVSDFKTVTSYRLIGKDQYEQVPPGGELKHGTLGNETYSNKADTYGLMLSIDRRDIINDDLGAITTVPRKLGRGSGLKINDVFWATFIDNAAFFKTGNNNYISGADTALVDRRA